MPDLPTLTIDIFPSAQGSQFCCLKLTLSSPTTNNEKKDTGELELPFPPEMVSIIQYLLNLKQENDKPSQLGPLLSLDPSESLKRPTISKDQEDTLIKQLELLDKMGRVVDDVHEKVRELLGSALRNNRVFKDCLQEFQTVGRTNGGDIVLRFNGEAWKLTALPWELAFKDLLVDQQVGCTRVISDPLPPSNQSLSSTNYHPPPTDQTYDKLRILAVASS